jgi:hypothetical protein
MCGSEIGGYLLSGNMPRSGDFLREQEGENWEKNDQFQKQLIFLDPKDICQQSTELCGVNDFACTESCSSIVQDTEREKETRERIEGIGEG